MNIKFLKYRKISYSLSGMLVLGSILSMFIFGLIPGIEFAGGSILEAEYPEARPPMEEITEALAKLDLGEISVQPLGERGVLIRTSASGEETHHALMEALEPAESKDFESIGPTVGRELRRNSAIAIILASLLVIFYIGVSFREKDGRVSSAKYGIVAAAIAFFHDILIILGIFALLGFFYGAQITIPITVALLTTLGYSINDTVVIFDRVRENLRKSIKRDLQEVINMSLNQTLGRSLSTSFTTLLVLFFLLFLAGPTLFYFILALIIGIILGTYSSIFLAGALVLDWNTLTERKKQGIR